MYNCEKGDRVKTTQLSNKMKTDINRGEVV